MKWFLLILLLALGGGLALLTQRKADPGRPALAGLPRSVPADAKRPEAAALASPGGGARADLKPKWQQELEDLIELQQTEFTEDFDPEPRSVHNESGLSQSMIDGAKENYSSQWLEDENGEEVRHGPWESTHPNGRTEELGAYDHGSEQGTWRWWYDDGTPQAVGQFEAGKRIGAWTWYHENGAVMMVGGYEDGEGSGEWIYYFDNGLVRGRGPFIENEVNGFWQFWHDDGSVDEERTGIYENGELVR